MTQAGGGETPAAPPATDAWTQLVHAVFRAVRGMSPIARVSTGERLEDAALQAIREMAAGRPAVAAQWLATVDLLLGVATELGDLSAAARSSVDSALGAARTTLPGA